MLLLLSQKGFKVGKLNNNAREKNSQFLCES